MGLFSSKHVTHVGTSISNYADAKAFVPANKRGVISAIARQESMSEHIMDHLITGSGYRSKKAYKYGGDTYIFGRPKDTVIVKNAANTALNVVIASYLTTTLGASTIYYTNYGAPNYYHKVYEQLHTNYGLNFTTGELTVLSAIKGFPVYLENISLLLNEANTEEDPYSFKSIWTYPVTKHSSTSVAKVGVEFTYSWTNILTFEETATLSTTFEFDVVEKTNNYFLAAYVDSSGNTAFLTYMQGGGISQLDNFLNTSYTVPGDYMPRLYFRWEAQPGNANITSVEYLHSKRMAKKVGIDYNEAVKGIHTLDSGRTQADLDQVKSVFLTWAIEADATTPLEKLYLFKHFENWFTVVGGVTTTDDLATFNANYTLDASFETVLVIEDVRFKVTVGMQGIWKRTVTGFIGVVGTYGSDKGQLAASIVESTEEGSLTNSINYPWHVYRYQDTANTYIEYQVVGLETKYYVSGDYASTSGWTEDVADPKDILYVPINYTVIETLKPFDQEEIMYRAMKIVANSLVVQKVKWYQTGFWAAVFKIIAIVAIVYGFYQGYQFLAALSTIATVSAVWAMELLFAALSDLLLNYVAIKLFVKSVGTDLAFLAAVVAAVYGYASNGFNLNMPYASDMAKLSQGVFKGVSDQLNNQFAALRRETEAFIADMEEKFDELKKVEETLNNKPLSNLLIVESPSNFYNRTIHSGNVGTRVFDLQENYVDMALTLPRNNFTIEV